MERETKDKKFGFRLPETQYQILQDIAKAQDRSVAAVIRRMMDEYFKNLKSVRTADPLGDRS